MHLLARREPDWALYWSYIVILGREARVSNFQGSELDPTIDKYWTFLDRPESPPGIIKPCFDESNVITLSNLLKVQKFALPTQVDYREEHGLPIRNLVKWLDAGLKIR
ncbi:hypothetical protein CDL15_Pgr029207 [Punica granatum]|uniref:Uncharacterized protein n=1 Tax=Punica granatum TaxID=22663 RepID=A0A218XDR3_PUNGR|nr:hypothetical protein CDL15_Pgr029207 [Punica granatum]PKI46463.1 hypothetical protein CRG98_033161 [Punica granatum]